LLENGHARDHRGDRCSPEKITREQRVEIMRHPVGSYPADHGNSLRANSIRPSKPPGIPTGHVKEAPVRDMRDHQRLEQATVVRDTKVQQLVGDHEILESGFSFNQIGHEGNGASGRA
jgi:hypothetical protein